MWVHRPVSVTAAPSGIAGEVVVHNRLHFTRASGLTGRWELLVDGLPVSAGDIDADIEPGGSRKHDLALAVPPKVEAHLRFTWCTRENSAWSNAGHVVAWDEVELTPSRTATSPDDGGSTETTGVGGVATDVRPVLTLWRPPTDNDGMKLAPHLWPMFGKSLGRWIEQGLTTRDHETLVGHSHERHVRADGSVVHTHVVDVPHELDDLPRVGVRFDLPEGFTRVRWFGFGPHETYPDRKSSALTGVWESDPDELPYLVPQEHGLRMQCRWMEFLSGDPLSGGEVIRVTAVGRPLHMSALLHTPEDLYDTAEQGLLPRRDRLTVHVDVAHRGLGTASCGPDTLPAHRVRPGRHEFSYVISRRAV